MRSKNPILQSLWLWCLLLLPLLSSGQATGLFISEYVEGSSNNKAIEIFNGTGSEVDLGGYDVHLYANGATSPTNQVNLGSLQATLEEGAVIVLKHASFTAFTGEAHDSSVANFNGDDVVALLSGGVVVDVIGAIGVRENIFANQTLRRNADVAGPVAVYDASQWTSFPSDDFDDLGTHTFAGAGEPDPEPSAYPTDLVAVANEEGTIRLSWTDAAGAVLPVGYLIVVSTDSLPTLPMDGAPVAADASLSDGAGALYAKQGEQAIVIGALTAQTDYRFTLFPYTNAGLAIDFKTDGTPPAVSATSALVLLNEDFTNLNGWTVVTEGADAEWELNAGAARANAFGSGGPADDWLVSAPLDLSLAEDFLLRFDVRQRFDDAGFNPALSVLVSSDYDGAGHVATATWTPLSVSLTAGETVDFVAISGVPLGTSGVVVYLAFRYQSSGTAGSSSEQWEIDNVVVYPSANPLAGLNLVLSTDTVPENAGLNALSGTVSIAEALGDPLAVSLQISRADLLEIPSEVVIPAGSTEGSFTIDVKAGLALTAPAAVTITPSATGYVGTGSRVTVQPLAARYLTVTIDPTRVDEDAGSGAASATVALSREAASYPLVVNLASSDPGELTLPASVTFASVADGLSKLVPLDAVADGQFDLEVSVTVQATAPGYEAGSDSVRVRNVDPVPAINLSVDPASFFENAGAGAATLTVTLQADPLGGYPFSVDLMSSAEDEATVPASVTFDGTEGRVRTVDLAAVTDGEVDGPQSVTLTASATGFVAGTTECEVLDVDGFVSTRVLGLLIQPSSVREGDGATGTIMLSSAPFEDLSVTLTNGDPTELTVPATVVVLAGASVATFSLQAVEDGLVDGDSTVSVIASATDWAGAQREVVVLDRDEAPVLSLEAVPASVDEGQFAELRVVANNVSEAGLRVALNSSDTTEVTVGDFVEFGSLVGEVHVRIPALKDGIVDADQTVTITASAPGYPLASTTVVVRNIDVTKTATSIFRRDSVDEGNTVAVDVVLNVPVTVDTTVALESTADLQFPDSVTIPAGSDAVTISAQAVADDGFEVDETVEWVAHVPGYLAEGDSVVVVNRDPRGQIAAPLDGARVPFDQTVRIAAEVADPVGSLEAVVFSVNGLEIARMEEGPFSLVYEPDQRTDPTEWSRALSITVEVLDTTLGDVTLSPVEVEIVFSPVLNNADFAYQIIYDLTGATPDETILSGYIQALDDGLGRVGLVERALNDPRLSGALWATETMLLVYDRFPTFDELYVDPMFSVTIDGATPVTVPPMADTAAMESNIFLSGAYRYPGGVRGVAHVLLHHKAEALEHFGGDVDGLKTMELFTPLWESRHGVAPTPQQIVQADTRLQQFETEAPYTSEQGNMEPAEFARARFVESLVFKETFLFGADVIFNPPNPRLWKEATVGLTRTLLWGDNLADRTVAAESADDLTGYIRKLLNHPRYWERNHYTWLGAVKSTEVEDWFQSEWLGHFAYNTETWPWVYHLEHGWFYVATAEPAAAGVWWFDLELGWVYTTPSVYPWMYLSSEGNWAFYAEGSSDPRWFWINREGAWQTRP